jgi:glutamyl-tRNA reductase
MLINIVSTCSSQSWPSLGQKIHKSWKARKFYLVGYGEVYNMVLRLIFKGNVNFVNIRNLNMI